MWKVPLQEKKSLLYHEDEKTKHNLKRTPQQKSIPQSERQEYKAPVAFIGLSKNEKSHVLSKKENSPPSSKPVHESHQTKLRQSSNNKTTAGTGFKSLRNKKDSTPSVQKFAVKPSESDGFHPRQSLRAITVKEIQDRVKKVRLSKMIADNCSKTVVRIDKCLN